MLLRPIFGWNSLDTPEPCCTTSSELSEKILSGNLVVSLSKYCIPIHMCYKVSVITTVGSGVALEKGSLDSCESNNF